MSVHLFGVRHHGPGCARSLLAALERLEPDIVLVEGPPDAHDALPLMMREAMQTPVALLIYAPDQPQRAVYYPFTAFSPEWQALRYAFGRGIPARFMDLPQAIQLAREPEPPQGGEAATPDADHNHKHEQQPDIAADAQAAPALTVIPEKEAPPPLNEHEALVAQAIAHDDPIGMLSAAAGYSDSEAWWEIQIEQRRDASDIFEGILEAMTELRSDLTPRNDEEAQREAHMRQTIRAAIREGYTRIAVVCGAWHAPALASVEITPLPQRRGGAEVGADEATLKGLKRVKVEATWIPWTNSRLSYRSGYGAGIFSPGWYEHLWTAPDRISIRWLTLAAHKLRAEGMDTSSASVIEAVRLAEALAAMRELPMPGLPELHEATQTVLCNGNEAPMQLIREKLEIGERMGEVPPETPAVPLQRDLEAQMRKLRLKFSGEIEKPDLDLRKPNDREKSQLFHRLTLLGIPWAKPSYGSRGMGTFHEYWETKWEPEYHIKLVEANIWGNTVTLAANAYAKHAADERTELPQLTALLDRVILAELPDALEHLLDRVQTSAAVTSDVQRLMEALPPLAQVTRYGDVRETKSERILPVIDALFERAIIGLPGACSSLDDDAARAMIESMNQAQTSLNILQREDYHATWRATLRGLMERDGIHGLVRGRCCRMLLEQHMLDDEELQRLARLALGGANPIEQAAAWIEGVVFGQGIILLHQDGLWRALDRWLSELDGEAFVAVLPLLRRAFSGFEGPERRQMGDKVRHLRGGDGTTAPSGKARDETLNRERADAVLPVLAQILGVDYHAN